MDRGAPGAIHGVAVVICMASKIRIISHILMSSLPYFYYFQDFMSVKLDTYNKLDGVKLSKEKVI